MAPTLAGHSGRDLLQLIKSKTEASRPYLSLPIGTPTQGVLRPVATRLEAQSDRDVHCLTEWRNKYVTSFLHEFTATVPQTRRWLATSVGPSDTRILFMVERLDGNVIGYMGLDYIDWDKSYGEADAVVRGKPAPKQFMTSALRTMLAWGASQLGLRQFWVRVRSDNPALTFYEKFGFEEVKRAPLRKTQADGGAQWVEDSTQVGGELTLVHMRLKSLEAA